MAYGTRIAATRMGSLALASLAVVLTSIQVGRTQSPADPTGTQVTFTKDVAPILQRACQNCHRPGSIAPMSLLTYEQARPWARAIKERVVKRAMPPWFIDRNVGVQGFKAPAADRTLSNAEIETLVKWVDGGAPMGNPKDLPPPREFDDLARWTIGNPDWVIKLPEAINVPANGPNWWLDIEADSGLTEDRWVKAYETKPAVESFPVVHHVAGSVINESKDGRDAGFGSEYALGKTGDILPDDTGVLIKAGSKITFNLHIAPNGKETDVQVYLGLQFYPKGYVPKRRIVRKSVAFTTDMDLPSGSDNVRTEGYEFLKENVRLTVYQPHMHNRGKRQCLEAVYTTGHVETLSCVDWDFGWHIAYNYADDVGPLLPKGTVLHIVSWHDNSAANKWNPDPKNWIGFGVRSMEDMSFAHISWLALSDEEFAQAVKERAEARKRQTSQ
jgi:hypothetical protein